MRARRTAMTKTPEKTRRFAFLDSATRSYTEYLGAGVYLCRTAAEIEKVYDEDPSGLTWVSWTSAFTDTLAKTVARRRAALPRAAVRRHERVLTVGSPRPESLATLHGLFPQIVGDSPGYRWLPKDELLEALLAKRTDRSELLLAGATDPVTETVTFVRGNFDVLVVPFSEFGPSGDGIAPDFSNIRVTDYGRTIAFGDYEASADAILYRADPEYRKTARRQRKESERSFGASLLRLRKERKLKRSDFRPLAAKTIARIERNEIGKPHGETLRAIAEKLGVEAEDIATY
ncbi:MAG: helix-turn-helix transcriptional regulator [Gemmataceae bacterium]